MKVGVGRRQAVCLSSFAHCVADARTSIDSLQLFQLETSICWSRHTKYTASFFRPPNSQKGRKHHIAAEHEKMKNQSESLKQLSASIYDENSTKIYGSLEVEDVWWPIILLCCEEQFGGTFQELTSTHLFSLFQFRFTFITLWTANCIVRNKKKVHGP